MLSEADLLSKELLKAFFLGDPRAWRLRQVTQITPQTPDSYQARTSYQFRFVRGLVQQAWWDAFQGATSRPALPDRDIDVILPIDYLPKYVLLNFSLEDGAGKRLMLLPSGDITGISFEVVRVVMTVLDDRCPDDTHGAERFFDANRSVLFALVATGQREIAQRLERLHAFRTPHPSETDYCGWMMAFLNEAFEQYTGQVELGQEERELCWIRLREIYREIERAPVELQAIIAGTDGFRDPLLNPALLIVDHLKASPQTAAGPPLAVLDSFLGACREFVSDFLQLAYDELRFSWVVGILRRMGRNYVAYARITVPLDRDFIVKMDQVIPARSGWSWKEPLRAFWYRNYQWYPIRIGDSRSTHIEVDCEHPIELQQVPGGTRLRVGERIVRASALFGRSSHETRYEQHFYTTKTGEQIGRALSVGAQGERAREMYDLKLGIQYAVEATTCWGYRLVSLVVLAALVFLVAVYDPVKMRAGQASFLPVIPVLFALFGALASLRPQESIVALRMRKYKTTVLAMGLVMAVYFLLGLIWPPAVAELRCLLQALGFGSFLL